MPLVVGRFAAAALALIAFLCSARRADAIPVFAHRYGLTCQTCHTSVPHLTDFGQRFLANGYRIEGKNARGAFPVAVKAKFAYSSEPDGSGLPKALVDEVEVLAGGAPTRRVEYFFEAYVVDGGRPGSMRDAWAAYRLPALVRGKVPLRIAAGQFTAPLPVDPETFRETNAHYAVFDQSVGANPFNFFDPKTGLQAAFGDPLSGTSATFALFDGHDERSGLRRDGVDRMLYAQRVLGAFVASAYRYDGRRPVCSQGDRFWRQGFGLAYVAERWNLDALLQTGFDGCGREFGAAVSSGGGFLQARYALRPGLFAIVRFDGTADGNGSFARSLLVGAGLRLARNSRLTLEDVLTHAPVTRHTFGASLLVAY